MTMKKLRIIKRGNLALIGLTGGIACGKTTVREYFEQLGSATIDTDAIARGVLKNGTKAHKAVIRRYGPDVLDRSGCLKRDILAGIVFGDPRERKWLESVTHPAVADEVNRRLKELSSRAGKKQRIVIIDIPLLFETGLEKNFEAVIVVTAARCRQIARLKERNALSRKEALARVNALWPVRYKLARADYVIENNDSRKELKIKVKYLWKVLTNSYKSV